VKSLINKLLGLHQSLNSNSYEIILITETFATARHDTCDKSGYGGVCVFIKKSLDIVEVASLEEYSQAETRRFDIYASNEWIESVDVYWAHRIVEQI
jgi:hypothetical protein